MSNQPSARSWFRLPNLGRQDQPPRPPSPPRLRPPVLRPALAQSFRPSQPPPPTTTTTTTPQPPPASPQQPRPPILRPAFAQSFRPTQPQPRPPQSPPPPPPPATSTPQPPYPSPPPRPLAAVISQPPSPSPTPPRAVPSPSPPMTSPKSVNTPSPPPTPATTNTYPPKSSSYPAVDSPGAIKPPPKPSPPPAREQSMVLVQAALNKQALVPSNSSRYDNIKDGRNMRVLSIGGENKGASMELGWRRTGGKQTGFNGNGNVGNEDQESDDFHRGIAKTSRLPMNAFVNNNVQSVNSSLLLDSSVTEHDPGVHFYFSKKPPKGIGKSNVDELGLKDKENNKGKEGKKNK